MDFDMIKCFFLRINTLPYADSRGVWKPLLGPNTD